MRRREFIAMLGGAAASWPPAAWAQQPGMPVIGFLRSSSLADSTVLVTAFRNGLRETGFVEGQNVAIEYRYADNQNDRLPILVADLIERPAGIIIGNTPSALAAKAATIAIPIVFVAGGDPVVLGLVTSLNRPGGNVTGVTFLAGVLGAKRLELLRQLVPNATTIGVLVNPNNQDTEAERKDVQTAAQAIGQHLIMRDVSSDRDIDMAFATFGAPDGAGSLLVCGGAFMFSKRELVAALAARYALPAIYTNREAVVNGGLMSYGPSRTDSYRQAGTYAGRILRGEKPADLPIMLSTKFEFVINLKTTKSLSLQIPDKVIAIADEVIE
jgi:putative tryptophan/tyrosine transport system substrate-binding protein